jgi:hypothetical protein
MYKQLKDTLGNIRTNAISRIEDNAFIPFDPANMDAQQFKIWLQEGNIPTSADGETIVTQEEVDAIITLLNG